MTNRPIAEIDQQLAEWRVRHSAVWVAVRWVSWTVATVLSPTLRIASLIKPLEAGRRSARIVLLNFGYLAVALCTAIILIAASDDHLDALRAHSFPLWWLWAWLLCSRCTEVLIAFYRDAMDQLSGKTATSDLTAAWRVRLALNSYVELVANYALIYCLLPEDMWEKAPARISEALWISFSTITTSGYAGFAPAGWLPQFLSATEIAGGVVLLVVCFALYVGGKADERRPQPDAG